jgi:hypothetical protein
MLHGVGGHATHPSTSLTGIMAPEGVYLVQLRQRYERVKLTHAVSGTTRGQSGSRCDRSCGVALPEGNLPSVGEFGDIAMFVMTEGKRAHGGGMSPIVGSRGFRSQPSGPDFVRFEHHRGVTGLGHGMSRRYSVCGYHMVGDSWICLLTLASFGADDSQL